MARTRRRSRLSLSLFPFLSVLACVMGTLVLLITASSTQQVAAGGVDLERYERLEQEIAASRRRVLELEGLTEELAALDRSLADARERAAALERERLAQREVGEELAPLLDTLRAEEERARKLARELEPVAAEAAARDQELRERRRVVADARIRIRPSGSGYGLDPHFVECRPEGIVYYEGLERRPQAVPTHRIADSAGYRRFLRAAVFRTNASVVFLIRQGGVDACEWARGIARGERLRHGEIPLPGAGAIDFSAVNGA